MSVRLNTCAPRNSGSVWRWEPRNSRGHRVVSAASPLLRRGEGQGVAVVGGYTYQNSSYQESYTQLLTGLHVAKWSVRGQVGHTERDTHCTIQTKLAGFAEKLKVEIPIPLTLVCLRPAVLPFSNQHSSYPHAFVTKLRCVISFLDKNRRETLWDLYTNNNSVSMFWCVSVLMSRCFCLDVL